MQRGSFKSARNTNNSQKSLKRRRVSSSKKKDDLNLFFRQRERAWNPSNKVSSSIKDSWRAKNQTANTTNFGYPSQSRGSIKQSRSKSTALIPPYKPRKGQSKALPKKAAGGDLKEGGGHSKNILSENYISNQIRGYIRKNQDFFDYKKGLKSEFMQKSMGASKDRAVLVKGSQGVVKTDQSRLVGDSGYRFGGSGGKKLRVSGVSKGGFGGVDSTQQGIQDPLEMTEADGSGKRSQKQNLKKTLREILSDKFRPFGHIQDLERDLSGKEKRLPRKGSERIAKKSQNQKNQKKASKSHEINNRFKSEVGGGYPGGREKALRGKWVSSKDTGPVNFEDLRTIKKANSKPILKQNQKIRAMGDAGERGLHVSSAGNLRGIKRARSSQKIEKKYPTVDTEKYVHFRRNYRATGGGGSDQYPSRYSKTVSNFKGRTYASGSAHMQYSRPVRYTSTRGSVPNSIGSSGRPSDARKSSKDSREVITIIDQNQKSSPKIEISTYKKTRGGLERSPEDYLSGLNLKKYTQESLGSAKKQLDWRSPEKGIERQERHRSGMKHHGDAHPLSSSSFKVIKTEPSQHDSRKMLSSIYIEEQFSFIKNGGSGDPEAQRGEFLSPGGLENIEERDTYKDSTDAFEFSRPDRGDFDGLGKAAGDRDNIFNSLNKASRGDWATGYQASMSRTDVKNKRFDNTLGDRISSNGLNGYNNPRNGAIEGPQLRGDSDTKNPKIEIREGRKNRKGSSGTKRREHSSSGKAPGKRVNRTNSKSPKNGLKPKMAPKTSTKISTKKNGMIESFAVNTITSKATEPGCNFDRVSVYFNYVYMGNHEERSPSQKKASGDAERQRVRVPFGFFGLYEGQGSSLCSDFMKKNLHHGIFKSRYFPRNLPMAIKQGILETEKEFREWFIGMASKNELPAGRRQAAKFESQEMVWGSGSSSASIFINLGKHSSHQKFKFFQFLSKTDLKKFAKNGQFSVENHLNGGLIDV